MAHAYKAIGECAARDFGCDFFGAPDQETKIELFSRSAVRVSLSARAAWSMCARCASATDAGSKAGLRDDRSGAAERPLTWRAGL
eukprot:4152766-Prymnesium_polylepis.1